VTRNLLIATALVAAGTLTACTRADGTRNNTATQTAAGAAAGAVIGNIIGDGDSDATIIGAAVGGIAGGALGNRLDRQQADLQQAIGGSGAGIVNTGDRLVVSLPEAISFDTGSADVRPTIRDDIIAVSRSLQRYPDTTVQVIGHTDNTGTASLNQRLSESRAQAVANILVASGTPDHRVRAYGVGFSQPIASNGTSAGRAANRRVEIVITPNR
jgi:outer membrane protein OmpA-like peptidoglycan-associated protein